MTMNKDTLRVITAPDGEWPTPIQIDFRPVTMLYRDFQGRDRSWRCTIARVRQGATTVQVDVLREGEDHIIALKLQRIAAIDDGLKVWPGMAFFTDHLGIEIEWTTGPCDANTTPNGPLVGERVAFVGEFDRLHYSARRNAVQDAGGTFVAGVDNRTTLLVIGTEVSPRSTKLRNARRFGTRMCSESEFVMMITGGTE